jgi:predicted RNA-binding protein with PIN domain
MPYIIDGNNLVGCAPDISLEDPDARKRILQVVKKFQENKKNNVIVVFDGEPDSGVRRQEESSKFTVVYPKDGNSADDEIKEILSKFHYFKDVVLVSSDRDLKSYAKKKGARTVNSIEFYFELKRFSHIHVRKEENQKRIEAELSETEVDQWLKIFNP